MTDEMDDKKLRDMLQARTGAPDDNARKRALNMALAEFDAAQDEKNQKTSKNFQGSGLWGRLTGNSNPNRRRQTMKKQYVYGGMATAMAVILAVGLGWQNFDGPQGRTQGDVAAELTGVRFGIAGQSSEHLAEAPGEEVSQAYEQAINEYNMETVERAVAPALKEGNSSLPVPQAAKRRAPQTESFAAADMAVAPAGVASSIAPMPTPMPDPTSPYYQDEGRDQFQEVQVSPVKAVDAEPVSTFSIDVDTAAYSVVRKMINNGRMPPADAVRVEEMVNYFDYDYALPETREQPFKPNVSIVDSPWADGRKLMHIGIKGFDVAGDVQPRSNLVFLIDVSGSMNAPDKLPLLKASMKMLLDQLGPEDTVAIATYAGAAGTVLEPTKASEKEKIIAAIDNMRPGGSTAGAAGINLAYQLAEANLKKDDGAVNRVILATDGDFNVGASSPDDLKKLIEDKRESGVFLSVLGFGMGNLNDHLMQTLAQNGNGTAAYIDNLNEARKVLVEEASSTLFPIAKDVKIQVEFNPATVAEYRLIGYETRALNREDFNNDAVDAGDIGAGHSVTAIYEITPVGGPRMIDESRYAANKVETPAATDSAFGTEYAFLKMRYKLPEEDTSKLITTPVTTADEKHLSAVCVDALCTGAFAGEDVEWAIAVAGFGQLLKDSTYIGNFDYDGVIEMAQGAKGTDEFGYRAEFINLVRLADTLE